MSKPRPVMPCAECGAPRWRGGTYNKFCDDCPPTNRPKTMRSRLFAKITKTDECWLWTGAKNQDGYGTFTPTGQNADQCPAHRVVYELLVGPIPEGFVLDHLCRVPSCMRPDHLEPVPFRENVIRGIGPTAVNAARTVCIYGHDFEHIIRRGRPERICRTCARLRAAKHRIKKGSAA